MCHIKKLNNKVHWRALIIHRTKMKFSIKDFFIKCDQIRSFLLFVQWLFVGILSLVFKNFGMIILFLSTRKILCKINKVKNKTCIINTQNQRPWLFYKKGVPNILKWICKIAWDRNLETYPRTDINLWYTKYFLNRYETLGARNLSLSIVPDLCQSSSLMLGSSISLYSVHFILFLFLMVWDINGYINEVLWCYI